MYICKNCGQTYHGPIKFCGKCGGDSFEVQMTYTPQSEYINPAPTYSYVSSPSSTSPRSAPAIIGMIFGILALLFAFGAFAMAMDALDVADNYHNYYSSRYLSDIRYEYLNDLTGLSIIIIPSIIVGLIMSFKRSAIHAMSIVGRVTSFISVGLWFFAFAMITTI